MDRGITIDDGSTPLGACPNCASLIPEPNLLIKYESAGGWPRMFAECPTCGQVVHPG